MLILLNVIVVIVLEVITVVEGLVTIFNVDVGESNLILMTGEWC
jgi:hypothetical protein